MAGLVVLDKSGLSCITSTSRAFHLGWGGVRCGRGGSEGDARPQPGKWATTRQLPYASFPFPVRKRTRLHLSSFHAFFPSGLDGKPER